jgi:hypothetical protein
MFAIIESNNLHIYVGYCLDTLTGRKQGIRKVERRESSAVTMETEPKKVPISHTDRTWLVYICLFRALKSHLNISLHSL